MVGLFGWWLYCFVSLLLRVAVCRFVALGFVLVF